MESPRPGLRQLLLFPLLPLLLPLSPHSSMSNSHHGRTPSLQGWQIVPGSGAFLQITVFPAFLPVSLPICCKNVNWIFSFAVRISLLRPALEISWCESTFSSCCQPFPENIIVSSNRAVQSVQSQGTFNRIWLFAELDCTLYKALQETVFIWREPCWRKKLHHVWFIKNPKS